MPFTIYNLFLFVPLSINNRQVIAESSKQNKIKKFYPTELSLTGEMSVQVGIKEKERGGLLVTGQADPLSLTRAE